MSQEIGAYARGALVPERAHRFGGYGRFSSTTRNRNRPRNTLHMNLQLLGECVVRSVVSLVFSAWKIGNKRASRCRGSLGLFAGNFASRKTE